MNPHLELSLPWPPKALSPNARKHWRGLAKAKAAYRDLCRMETLLQCHPSRVKLPNFMHLVLEFVPPDRRKRDRDNLLASMKSGLDGMADALGINDARFTDLTVRMVETVTRAKGAASVRVKLYDAYRPPLLERDADGMPSRMML